MNEKYLRNTIAYCLQFQVTENVVLFTVNAQCLDWIGLVWFNNFIELICYGSIECVLCFVGCNGFFFEVNWFSEILAYVYSESNTICKIDFGSSFSWTEVKYLFNSRKSAVFKQKFKVFKRQRIKSKFFQAPKKCFLRSLIFVYWEGKKVLRFIWWSAGNNIAVNKWVAQVKVCLWTKAKRSM